MITEQQFFKAAEILQAPISVIKAVYEVEAAGRGYLPDGRVKILFEGHRLWKILNKKGVPENKLIGATSKYPNVLYKKWNKKQYKGGAEEWDRMSEAYLVCDLVNIGRGTALEAASYGSFQIMGENYKLCGYDSAQAMLAAYNNGGEAEQLNSFIRFVKSKKIDGFLRNKQWAKFASAYNGTAYRENMYDVKLAAADRRFSGRQ